MKEQLVINFTKRASVKMTEDFKMLLEDLREYFNFNWFVSGKIKKLNNLEIKK
jgi:hypothetical protein